MKHNNILLAALAMTVALFAAQPASAASDQYKEEAVQQAHQPEVAPAPQAEVVLPVADAPATVIAPAQPEAAAPAAAQQRRRMETPVLLMVIGGAMLLLAIVFTIIAIASLNFGAAYLTWIFWTFGWLALLGGFIWWLVER